MTSEPTRNWGSGQAYEPYVGRWSRLVARQLLEWLRPRRGLRWLDVGCGTGALTNTILELAEPSAVTGVDPSEVFVAHAAETIRDPRANFVVGNASELRFGTQTFDFVVSGLVLNFVPNPASALLEMGRVCRIGGTVASYIWDYSGKMELMRYFWDTAVELDPVAKSKDEGNRFPIADRKKMWELFLDARLNDVQTRALDAPTHFQNYEDYWTPFLSNVAPAPEYAMSLSSEDRDTLRDTLRARLPINDDGSIDLIARAWAARGVR